VLQGESLADGGSGGGRLWRGRCADAVSALRGSACDRSGRFDRSGCAVCFSKIEWSGCYEDHCMETAALFGASFEESFRREEQIK